MKKRIPRYALVFAPAICLALLGYVLLNTSLFISDASSNDFINQLEANAGKHPGHRRNHTTGLCVSGYFEGNGEASELSVANIFTAHKVPVTGRLSFPGGGLSTTDDKVPMRSLALALNDGIEQWRMALLSAPVFPVATPEVFYQFLQAQAPDPQTHKPDGARVQAFFQQHPETNGFRAWAKSLQRSGSFANTQFNSINAFVLTDAQGNETAFRWSLVPHLPFSALNASQDYPLFDEFSRRLKAGPVQWDLLLTLATPADDPANATVSWPDSNPTVKAGTLTLTQAGSSPAKRCQSINFDPTVLPHGITVSNDPLLPARAAVYQRSFNARTTEQVTGDQIDD